MKDSYILYKSKLTGNYKEVFEKIDVYMGTANIDSVSKEELMQSVLDTFLTAQENRKPVEKITGKNIERFCRELCSGFGIKEHFIAFAESLKPMIYGLFLISVVELILLFAEYQNHTSFNLLTYDNGSSLPGFLFGIILAYFLDLAGNKIVKKLLFAKKIPVTIQQASKIHMALLFALIAVYLILIIIFDDLLKSIEFNIPLWISILITWALFIIVLIVNQKLNQEKSVKNITVLDNYENITFFRTFEKAENEKFEKKNRKRISKGMKELSKEEFIEQEIAGAKKGLNPLFYILFPIILTISFQLPFMPVLFPFDSFMDRIFFSIFSLSGEYIIMAIFYHSLKKITLKEIAWLESQKKTQEEIEKEE